MSNLKKKKNLMKKVEFKHQRRLVLTEVNQMVEWVALWSMKMMRENSLVTVPVWVALTLICH